MSWLPLTPVLMTSVHFTTRQDVAPAAAPDDAKAFQITTVQTYVLRTICEYWSILFRRLRPHHPVQSSPQHLAKLSCGLF